MNVSMRTSFFAHVKQNANGAWVVHPLNDHLRETAQRAGEFAETFGNHDWAELLGYWHDLGKFQPAWQKYLRRESGYEEENQTKKMRLRSI
jgi:CRISPR-associated endonuclease/helicase Cas3